MRAIRSENSNFDEDYRHGLSNYAKLCGEETRTGRGAVSNRCYALEMMHKFLIPVASLIISCECINVRCVDSMLKPAELPRRDQRRPCALLDVSIL